MGCKRPQQKIVYEKDSVKLAQDFLPGVASSPSPEVPSLQKRTIGVWIGTESPDPVFEISADSVFYFAHDTSYKYLFDKDSIDIKYDDYDYKAKVYFKNDTMVMNSPEYGIAKFWKFKN
ncbi:hypothetical protein BC343_27470 [Mucilaginibacter pedocola]|uniref:Lipocalin-like domain-containing protein n=2 Tax=Mucilaginibacter pedocola TaxID=1792845 RepID=A0A1S9PGI6_9SPHI|nr:hypothetical protein BC343_27470 [Mucilaginibacter pedocola]